VRIAAVILVLPLLAAASAPVQQAAPPLDLQLQQARADQASAEKEAARLEQAAARARGDLDRLRAEQAASAQAIEAAEARITAADMQLRLTSAYVAAHRQQLADQQRPVSSLLAGLALMADRPPILVIVGGGGGTDELVKVRVLLDSTIPVIRARTAKLSAELNDGQRLEQAAIGAQRELVQSRQNLMTRRQQFAALEQKALQLAAKSSSQALSAGDVAIAAGENVESLKSAQASSRAAASMVSELAGLAPAPPRPIAPQGSSPMPPFAYDLPAAGAVTEGLAYVNESGVRARGITLATSRGAAVTAPAAGTVRFSGPFQDYDGVLIIDHGGGWMSLIVDVASTLRPGDRVALGQPIGRALGPLQVELSQNGRRISPALIAGSSQSLSNGLKGG
jgi:septal ring factor EnvC (AmiA/AmiB activator)